MKTLDLVLKKKWYDMIESGEKTEEYREIKQYWIQRLMRQLSIYACNYEKVDKETELFYSEEPKLLKRAVWEGGMIFKDFDQVTFHLGYAKNRPSMTFELDKIKIGKGKSEWGAEDDKLYFVIHFAHNRFPK